VRGLGRLGVAALLFFLARVQAPAADLLTNFKPSPLTSEYGLVQQVEIKTPYLLAVQPDELAFHSPGSMLQLRFPEAVWIIAYETDIYDATGQTPQENFLCHTFLGNQRVDQQKGHDGHVISSEMRVVFSDAFTRSMHLPEGFGIRLSPEDDALWSPMFNNRTSEVTRLGMRAVVHFIREADLKKPLQPIYSILEAVQTPHLFFVPPGRHQKDATFTLDFEGKIHFMGAHVHPYSESIELLNVSRNELVWKGRSKTDEKGETSGMEVYSNSEGYPVHAGETYMVRSTYDNPKPDHIDAMAGVFIFYSRDDSPAAGHPGASHIHPSQTPGR
jgi:hypothetical protein